MYMYVNNYRPYYFAISKLSLMFFKHEYDHLFITSHLALFIQVQNSRLLTIANNYIVHNFGGIRINSTTNSLTTAIWSNVTNNVMVFNTHGEMLHIEGNFCAKNGYRIDSYRDQMSEKERGGETERWIERERERERNIEKDRERGKEQESERKRER